jgi:hypothetical protein
MSRVISVPFTVPASTVYVGGVRVPEDFHDVFLFHKAWAGGAPVLKTNKTAIPVLANFLTDGAVWDYKNSKILTLSDLDVDSCERLTEYFRGLGGWYVAWVITQQAGAITGNEWRFVMKE